MGRGLVQICAGTPPSAQLVGSDGFLRLLRRHRLAPLGHVVLARAGSPDAELLRPDLLEAVGGHLRSLTALRRLTELFDGLPWAVLKGPVLSELAHPVPGVRAYADLDVLVHPADLAEALTRLRKAEWALRDGHHRLVRERVPGEIHLLGPSGAQIDLHWSLVNAARARAALRFSTRALLERRVARRVGPLDVKTLDDVDMLLHLCVHAALSGADRMLWLLDVDQWCRRVPLDWSEVLERARRAGAGPAVAVVLSRAARTLHTPVPKPLVRAMPGGAWWRAVDHAVTSLQPVPGITRNRSLPRLVARSSRAGSLSSSAELLRRSAGALRPRRAVESAWQARPDEDAWQAFLSHVARQE